MAKVYVYDKDKYAVNLEKVNKACYSIIASRELFNENHQSSKDKLGELIGDLYLSGLDARIFLLTGDDGMGHKNLPASFAIFTSTDKPNSWIMEMIYTHKKRSNVNNAENLLKYALKYLKENMKVEEVVANVANNNTKSLNFHNKMLNTFVYGKCIKTDGENIDPEEVDVFDGENEDDILNNPNFDSDLIATNAGITKFYFDLTKEFKDDKALSALSKATLEAQANAMQQKIEKSF